jgi:hypothetical protein
MDKEWEGLRKEAVVARSQILPGETEGKNEKPVRTVGVPSRGTNQTPPENKPQVFPLAANFLGKHIVTCTPEE